MSLSTTKLNGVFLFKPHNAILTACEWQKEKCFPWDANADVARFLKHKQQDLKKTLEFLQSDVIGALYSFVS